MPPKFRKRPREEEIDEQGDSLGVNESEKAQSDDQQLRSKLALVREEQKLRARGAGVDASTLSLGNTQRAEEQRIELQKTAAAAVVAANSSALLSLGSFEKSDVGALSTGRGKSGEELEDPKMVAFVEERLRMLRKQESEVASAGRKRGDKNEDEDQQLDLTSESVASTRVNKEEEYLQDPSKMYAIPAHLDASADVRRGGGGQKKRNDADVGAGGVMLGGTGIAEIALPEKEKSDLERKTIEAVHKLMAERSAADEEKRRRADQSGGGGRLREPSAGGVTYGSISSNFDQHRREWISNERSSGNSGRGVKPGQASDDKLFSLFKKREREGVSNR